MLKQFNALLSRSTFLTDLARNGRKGVLSGARRLGWVRLSELSAVKTEGVAAQQGLKAQLERQTKENEAVQSGLEESKRKSTAFAQQLEIWRARAADYKQGAGLQAEKLAASRSRVKNLEQKAERLSAECADAEERVRNLIAAMRLREMAAAQDLSLIRTSLARARQQEAPRGWTDQESALLAEIGRLGALAEAQGQTLHRAFDASNLLYEMRSGRMALVSFSLDDVVGDYPPRSALLLTSDAGQKVDPGNITRRGVFEVRSVSSSLADEAGRFDLVVTAFDLEEIPDPVDVLGAAAGCVATGGRIVILGAASGTTLPTASSLWRTPPKMLQSLLPAWTWERFILVGPGGRIGIEIVDPTLLLEFRPAPGQGAPLLAPPYMSFVAVARNQSRGHQV